MDQQHQLNPTMAKTANFPTCDDGPDTLLLGCKKLVGQRLKNHHGAVLGTISSIVIDLKTGRISYAVLACAHAFVEPPRLFAVPWHALVLDADRSGFSVEAELSELQRQSGCDRNLWPASADPV
jgi:hypothetical protein